MRLTPCSRHLDYKTLCIQKIDRLHNKLLPYFVDHKHTNVTNTLAYFGIRNEFIVQPPGKQLLCISFSCLFLSPNASSSWIRTFQLSILKDLLTQLDLVYF